jgi:prepilin-type N-terminal cleavage/methylation domain-containing protein
LRRHEDEGFTLLEVMVAMVILGLVAVALVPVLITSSRAEQYARRATLAKNLAQQRVDAMRNLPFHVDAQNGPFLDLLDNYYPNIKTTTTTLPGGGTGVWHSSGTIPGSSASGPYYQATFNNALGVNGFTQVVYTQFLTSAQPLPAAVPATTLTAMGYDANAVGKDQSPSLLLGVSVTTSWQSFGGKVRSNRTYTEMTNTGNDAVLILSQARATALLVQSNAWDGSQLEAGLGVVKVDGSLANTSSAHSYAQGAYMDTVNGVEVASTPYSAVSPASTNPSGITGSEPQDGAKDVAGSGQCNGGSYGPTQVTDVSSNILTGGLPLGPSDVGSGGLVQANMLKNGGGLCNGLYFTNQTSGAPATNPKLQLANDQPMVNVSDASGSGNLITSNGYVNATNAVGTAGAISSAASVGFVSTRVQIFRGLSFVPQGQSVCSATGAASGTSACGNGLVNVFITSASITCKSQTTTTATYSGYLTYYTSTGWKSVALSWTSGGSTTDPLASVNLSQQVATYNGNPVLLSDYISSWSSARSISTSSDGSSALPGVVAINTTPTRTGDSGSSIGVQLGNLSCVAVDNR